MGLNDTQSAERVRIGFFGLRNAGKSSLVNAVTGQPVSVVSDVKGTTTDPVQKSMELLPLGPVTVIDTPGFDDEGELGALRVKRTLEQLAICDIAVLVTEHSELNDRENELLSLIEKRGVPHLVVQNKADITGVGVSSLTGKGVNELKDKIAALSPKQKTVRFVADLIGAGDRVLLVIPIDSSAPKGRLILPQQQALRDILDAGGVSAVTGLETLPETLERFAPRLVITDSQVFGKVMKLVPESVPLTSFSILMARYKGFLDAAVRGAAAIDTLKDGDKVLVCEGCTHHRQCEDIGTVKLPAWIEKHTGVKPRYEFTSGHGFPENPDAKLIIHCGGCMLGDGEVAQRMKLAEAAGVPVTNYGVAIAYMNGILRRSLEPLRRN